MTAALVLAAIGAHALIVGVIIALVLALIVGVAFHFVAPQYAAPAALVTFLVALLVLLL